MGRKTWQSIENPLTDRLNAILTKNEFPDALKNKTSDTSQWTFPDMFQAILTLSNLPEINELFVIGGQSLFEEAIELNLCKMMVITRILKPTFEYDTQLSE